MVSILCLAAERLSTSTIVLICLPPIGQSSNAEAHSDSSNEDHGRGERETNCHKPFYFTQFWHPCVSPCSLVLTTKSFQIFWYQGIIPLPFSLLLFFFRSLEVYCNFFSEFPIIFFLCLMVWYAHTVFLNSSLPSIVAILPPFSAIFHVHIYLS